MESNIRFDVKAPWYSRMGVEAGVLSWVARGVDPGGPGDSDPLVFDCSITIESEHYAWYHRRTKEASRDEFLDE